MHPVLDLRLFTVGALLDSLKHSPDNALVTLEVNMYRCEHSILQAPLTEIEPEENQNMILFDTDTSSVYCDTVACKADVILADQRRTVQMVAVQQDENDVPLLWRDVQMHMTSYHPNALLFANVLVPTSPRDYDWGTALVSGYNVTEAGIQLTGRSYATIPGSSAYANGDDWIRAFQSMRL